MQTHTTFSRVCMLKEPEERDLPPRKRFHTVQTVYGSNFQERLELGR